MTSRKRILVTGGAGFVGSHLCERLLELSNEVICLDDLSTGSRDNIFHLHGNRRFSFVEHNVEVPFDCEVDAIFNMACPASPPHYQRDPVSTVKTNVLGMINMLDLARRNNAKLVQASTSEVYGDPQVHPQPESYLGNVNPIGPRACYDEGKRVAETLCFDYRRTYGVDAKVVRIFNTYGPRLSAGDGRVVSNFIVQALAGRDLTVYGDGSQTRSFCYVDDLVDGLIRMMASDFEVSGPINLGNPTELPVGELARLIIDLTGSMSTLRREPLPVDDPKIRRPDISRANDLLGWRPQVSLEQGLGRTIASFAALVDRVAAE
ncbi:MAG: SDR family oxidoreductase [Azospirillaceae bacterium]